MGSVAAQRQSWQRADFLSQRPVPNGKISLSIKSRHPGRLQGYEQALLAALADFNDLDVASCTIAHDVQECSLIVTIPDVADAALTNYLNRIGIFLEWSNFTLTGHCCHGEEQWAPRAPSQDYAEQMSLGILQTRCQPNQTVRQPTIIPVVAADGTVYRSPYGKP